MKLSLFRFTKMIEDGRTLNCSKTTGIKMHEIPFKSHKKYNDSGISGYQNGSCNLGLEHVELHFNITNVFEDNSDSHPMSAQQYVDYEEESNNGTDTESESSLGLDQDNNTDSVARAVGKLDKKSHGKSVNSPVYVIIT